MSKFPVLQKLTHMIYHLSIDRKHWTIYFSFPRQAFALSDPGVHSLDRRPYCSVCKNNSHFTRGCTVRFAGPSLREDDSLVETFLTTRAVISGRPVEQFYILKKK